MLMTAALHHDLRALPACITRLAVRLSIATTASTTTVVSAKVATPAPMTRDAAGDTTCSVTARYRDNRRGDDRSDVIAFRRGF